MDSPGDPEVKALPANAGDMGLILGPGTKISHTTRQLSPYTTSTEAPMPYSPHTTTTEFPLSATRESLHTATKTQYC